MRGKSQFNRQGAKQGEVYAILRKLGGEATWTELWKVWEKHERGKSTLSLTLDAMVEKGTVQRVSRLGTRSRGKGSHSQVWYILTERGAGETIKNSAKTVEETLVILSEMGSKGQLFPGCEDQIRDLLLGSKELTKGFQNFETEYNRIKKEGQLIARAGGEKE